MTTERVGRRTHGGRQPGAAVAASPASVAPLVLAPAPRPVRHPVTTLLGRGVQVLADVVAVLVAVVVVAGPQDAASGLRISPLLVLVAPTVFVLVFANLRLFSARTVAFALEEVKRVVYGSAVAALIVGYVMSVRDRAVSPSDDAALAALAALLLILERRITRRYFSARRRRGRGARRTVLVGRGADGDALFDMIATNPDLGYRIAARVGCDGRSPMDDVRAIVTTVHETDATDVLLAEHALDGATTKALARVLHEAGVRVELSSGLTGIDATRLTVAMIGGKPVFHADVGVARRRHRVHRRRWRVRSPAARRRVSRR